MNRVLPLLLPLMIAVAGCTTIRETEPGQTARHQLLLSNAADDVSARIAPNLPAGTRIYVDTTNFGSEGEYRSQYLISAIKAALLRQGYGLTRDIGKADTILDVSNGALSIDRTEKLFGIPSADIPIPLAGDATTPEVALWKSKRRTGIAKVLLSFYDAETGTLQSGGMPLYGYSHYDRSSILFYGRTDTDLEDTPTKARKTR